MRITEQNWMQVQACLQREDRAVLPLGSTEQHAYLSLSTDAILAERVAVEAAEPLGVPVFPALAYGISPCFLAYPGSVSLRVETYLSVVRDILDCLAGSGFRCILLVNGHGGNAPVQGLLSEWMADHPGMRVRLHNWWNAPRTWAKVMEIDPVASHASWMENFPWTRLAGVTPPTERKPMVDIDHVRLCDPAALRALIGDGNYGGHYQRADAEMEAIWKVAVEETRELLERPWF
ncbi:MAG: creatininase family protein [Candidatus Methylomirabilota bacterium]|jgi:creatinine amidohydrolase